MSCALHTGSSMYHFALCVTSATDIMHCMCCVPLDYVRNRSFAATSPSQPHVARAIFPHKFCVALPSVSIEKKMCSFVRTTKYKTCLCSWS